MDGHHLVGTDEVAKGFDHSVDPMKNVELRYFEQSCNAERFNH
jgi:hypothetical protein